MHIASGSHAPAPGNGVVAGEGGEGEGSSRLEAAAAASTLCLEMRIGAMLTTTSDLTKLYPAWTDMTRGTVTVDTSSRWGWEGSEHHYRVCTHLQLSVPFKSRIEARGLP